MRRGPMRRIVMFNWLTTDGYFSGPDGNLDWVVPDEEQAKAAARDIANCDTVLFGRRTYERFERFWRHADDDASTAPDPHRPGQRSREHRTIAVALNEMTKLVFSRTLKDVTWKNARLLHELDPREIETMKSRPGKDMIVFGSGSIVSQLTQHGLIDEYRRNERADVLQTIGCGMRDDDTKGERRDRLLKFDATVHRDQNIVVAAHPAQKLAILDSGPAAAGHGINSVAGEIRSEVYG